MMAFSLSQLAVLLGTFVIVVGAPIVVVAFVRRGVRDDLRWPLKLLHWGFWLTILSFAAAMARQQFLPEPEVLPRLAANTLAVAFYVFAWLYWTSLAVLARRAGRSAALWVALGLVTLAIGFVATYILMGRHVRSVLKTNAA